MPDTDTNTELTIEKLVYGGQGLTRRNGQVILVPFVLPGETVHVKEETGRRGLVEAHARGSAYGRPEPHEPSMPIFPALRRMPVSARRLSGPD